MSTTKQALRQPDHSQPLSRAESQLPPLYWFLSDKELHKGVGMQDGSFVKLVTRKQISNLLGVCSSTVDRQIVTNVKKYRIGKSVRYNIHEIIALIEPEPAESDTETTEAE